MNLQPVTILENQFGKDPKSTLVDLARRHGLRWLLAHADDGVIWGEILESGLHLSSDAFPEVSPPLRTVTLQQARLFGSQAELLIWRDGAAWRARLIRDISAEQEGEKFCEETYLLWGTHVEERRNGFALLREGRQGLRHAPPLPENAKPPARLRVRHYLAYDEDGQAYIACSRLVDLEVERGEK